VVALWTPPAPGDIVWCRFPNLPRRSPGPKPRPALVVTVTEREDGIAVVVAHGTSQRVSHLFAGEFAITRQGHSAAYASSGLSYDTKFALGQTIERPWNEDFFAIPPNAPHGQHPKLGVLHASMMRSAASASRAVKR